MKKTLRILLYIFFIIAVITIWSLSHFEVFGKDAFEPESANVLIAGLAFAGVIIGLHQQQSEIQLQREDLKAQLKELENTRKEFELNRLTNILYQQVEKINSHILNFNTGTHKGYFAVSNTARGLKPLVDAKTISWKENKLLDQNFDDTVYNAHIINHQIDELYDLLSPSSSNFKAFEIILKESALKQKEKKELLMLLKFNLSSEFIVLVKSVDSTIKSYEYWQPTKNLSIFKDDLKILHIKHNAQIIRSVLTQDFK